MIDTSSSLRRVKADIEAARRKRAEEVRKALRKVKFQPFDYGTDEPNVSDYLMAKNCGEVLERHYPGWSWRVGCGKGVIRIHSPELDMQYGMLLHEDKVDAKYRLVIRAGGELLERYRMPRSRFDLGRFEENARHGINMHRRAIEIGGRTVYVDKPRPGQSLLQFDGDLVTDKHSERFR